MAKREESKMDNNSKIRASHYETMNTLFNAQRDFIVIGLCGQTGSGVSTVAKLLERKFSDLHLPSPGDGKPDENNNSKLYSEHEYQILYKYAEKNWAHFNKIKVSALITARVLEKNTYSDFSDFLLEQSNNLNLNITKEDLDAVCEKFFEQYVYFDLLKYTGKTKYKPVRYKKCSIPMEKDKNRNETRLNFCIKNSKVRFKNKDLYRLFCDYGVKRKNRNNFSDNLFYWILKQYIYEILPILVSGFWNKIAEISKGLPDLAMQMLGVHLRIGRKPFLDENASGEFQKDGFAIIAEDINLAIKLLRTYQEQWFLTLNDNQRKELGSEAHRHTLVVIDSIKNPFESMYLKQRYSNYYLMGVYTEEVEREQRLLKKENFSSDEIQEIAQIERLSQIKKAYKQFKQNQSEGKKSTLKQLCKMLERKNLYNELPFISQNVEKCLEAADIFINNDDDNRSLISLKKTLLRYICLIMYPGLLLPTPVERCMQLAYTAKANSGCISRQVGAVITDRAYHLLSIGWNQQPEGQLPCSYRNLIELCSHFSNEVYSDYENEDLQNLIKENVRKEYDCIDNPLKIQGRFPVFCFKDLFNRKEGKENQVHPRALHGEETAFLNLGPVGKEQAKGGCLFTTSSPCELCAKKAMYMEISYIYYVEPYSGISYKHVLSAGPKEKRPQFILFTGAVGRAYMQLYTPLLPLKDEHEMWMGQKTENILIPREKN